MSILTENWHTWYIGGVDSESRLRFLKFQPQNPFLGKFGPKNSKFCLKIGTHNISRMLIPNPDLDFWNFDPKIYFWANFGPKIQSCLFCLKIGTRSISRILIPNSDLDFWHFDHKIHFWANFDPKIQSCLFCLKIGTQWYLKDVDTYSNIIFLNFKF